jgi:UDP-3-O-[3-hydroxymyristoyl] N-acetylglucosamine deacetylase/3-hydroxyacyl-[acyl-carrier-protein] dehydratase
MIGISEIMKYLPHRYPFLMVDRIIEFEENKRVVGIKNVTINEPFFQGHFPGQPIMPGVLLIEAMAQVGGVLALHSDPEPETKLLIFMSIDKAKFRKPVVPGDQVRLEQELIKSRGPVRSLKARAIVDGAVVAEAEMMAMIVNRTS